MKMNIIFLLLNAITECVYIACVTYAAVHFEKISILWWYVMVLLLRVTWTSTKEAKK